MRNPTNAEYLLALKTAREYRSKGYDVSTEVLLDFFPNFLADLVVRKVTDLHKYRNAIAHGFSHDDLDIEMVLELIETTRRLTNGQNAEEYAQT